MKYDLTGKHGTNTGYGYGCRCEACRRAHREYAQEHHRKHPEIRGEYQRRRRLADPEGARRKDRERYSEKRRIQVLAARRLKTTGVDPEQFAALLALQEGKCAICGTDKPNGRGDWHVDHDHATGRVRGLLCHNCNIGLGNLGDAEERLMAALAYLRREIDLVPRNQAQLPFGDPT